MRHRPHLLVAAPWSSDVLAVPQEVSHHLGRVLRYAPGDNVSYTDGDGTIGDGTWNGSSVERGSERLVPAPRPRVTIAVAPPKARDRQRFLVEKLQELGTNSLVWIRTERTEGRPPASNKAMTWAIAALEQSRGAFLMQISNGGLEDMDGALVADAEGHPLSEMVPFGDALSVVIGPEGGLTGFERSSHALSVSMGRTTLRTETAAVAIVAAINALSES
jgi:16S rRNA (uracil1498-N3)-methyltransferase